MINAISKILGRKKSNSSDTGNGSSPPKVKESIWQKATSLRQSLRHPSRAKVSQKNNCPTPEHSFLLSPTHKGTPCSSKREWGSQKNLARERKSLALAPKYHSNEVTKRSLQARSLCVVSGEDWDFESIVKSTPEGMNAAESCATLVSDLPRHQRSSRKLTKDSGYETSAQGDPDYINTLSDWLSEEKALDKVGEKNCHLEKRTTQMEDKINNSVKVQIVAEKRLEWNTRHRPLSFSHQEVPVERKNRQLRHSYSQREATTPHYENYRFRQPSVDSLRCPTSTLKPESRYSSVESVSAPNKDHLAKSTPHLANLKNLRKTASYSVTNLLSKESDAEMVTIRFKKGSVYDALASASGLDFSPLVQLKTYNSRREESPSDAKRLWDESTANKRDDALKKESYKEKNNASTDVSSNPVVSPTAATSDASSSQNEFKKNSPQESKLFIQQPLPPVPASPSDPYNSCITSHEKYPSWPVTSEPNSSLTFRSHSWIPQTDYPKEKVGYLRPKKSFKISTNQLQPVFEKSPDSGAGKKSPDSLSTAEDTEVRSSLELNQLSSLSCSGDSTKTFHFDDFHTPCRPPCYVENDYNIHSPPERDTSSSTCSVVNSETTSNESNCFLSKYEHVLQHQAQYSAPLSFWNKSPGSDNKNHSVDTPFLDRLRLDNARAWPQAPPPPPPPAPLPANFLVNPPNNNNNNNNDIELSSENGTWMGSMESSSQGRGISKWQGSYSDLSTMSTQLSNRSSLFDSGHSTMPESGRLSPQSSCGSIAPSLLLEGPTRAQVVARHGCHREIVAHSARVQQPERHGSESVLYYTTSAPLRPKTALCFNVDDEDSVKSLEPVAGPSGVRFNSSVDRNKSQTRCKASPHDVPSHLGHYRKDSSPTTLEACLPTRKSRSSNSFSSEDSNLKSKDVSDDTSGSSSDVSNITCISNFNESFASSHNWESSSRMPKSPPKPNSNDKTSSKSGSSLANSSKFHSSNNVSSAFDTSEKFRKSSVPSQYEITHTGPTRHSLDLSPHNRLNRQLQQPSAEKSSSKSRSMDDTSRKQMYNDMEKRQRISEPDLKTIQKQAVFSFYQRMSLAESVRSSCSYDSSRCSIDQEAPPPYELPSPTRLKTSMTKFSLLPNKFVPQEFDDQLQNGDGSSNGEHPSSLMNPHSKSVPNLLNLKNKTGDSFSAQRPPCFWNSNSSGQNAMKRGSPLAKDEIIPWDQLPSVLEKKREAEKASLISESKEPPEDGSSNSSNSSASNYFKGHKSSRKVQLKEVHHTNETSSVKVITHDGVTLVQTTNGHHHHNNNNLHHSSSSDKKSKEDKTKAHHKRRPAPPPPPKQPSKRPPPPPPPESPPPPPPSASAAPIVVILEEGIAEAVDKELQELRIDENHLEVSGGRRPDGLSSSSSSSSPQLLNSFGEVDGECCSSPDLPLPPPPSSDSHGEVIVHEPLPPPPEVLGVEISNRTLDSSLVYPKNSYMSYRSEKKLGRQGFEGNYRRSFHTSSSSVDLSTVGSNGFLDGGKAALSPSSWEFVHNIRQHGTTVIFHSDALRCPNGKLQRSTSQELPSNGVHQVPCHHPSLPPATSQDSPGSDSTSSPADSPSTESKTNDSIVIQCDDVSCEDISSLDNGILLTDDSYVDSPAESDTSSLISIDQNQNSVDFCSNKCDRTVVNNTKNNLNNDTVVRTNSSTQTSSTLKLGKKCKTKEELECERLSANFLQYCGDVKLKNLLVPSANHKTMFDYLDGLLNVDSDHGGLQTQRWPEDSSRHQNGHRPEDLDRLGRNNGHHFNHYVEIIENQNYDDDLEGRTVREELMSSIKKKLEAFRCERHLVREEMQLNDKIGKDLANRVQKLAKTNEVQKYVLHVEEMEKIVNLLLSLSGRLAKAENMLANIPADTGCDEKRILEGKRCKLLEQHEDARKLKESIDRRSNQISAFLHKYFSDEEYADYDYFMKIKTRLIVDARSLDDKINFGEEQLSALRNAIIDAQHNPKSTNP